MFLSKIIVYSPNTAKIAPRSHVSLRLSVLPVNVLQIKLTIIIDLRLIDSGYIFSLNFVDARSFPSVSATFRDSMVYLIMRPWLKPWVKR